MPDIATPIWYLPTARIAYEVTSITQQESRSRNRNSHNLSPWIQPLTHFRLAYSLPPTVRGFHPRGACAVDDDPLGASSLHLVQKEDGLHLSTDLPIYRRDRWPNTQLELLVRKWRPTISGCRASRVAFTHGINEGTE